MQFLESSVIGLRAAIYELSSPNQKLRILLFPMVHIGNPTYYDEISRRLDECDNVVFEGVQSSKVWFLVQSYKIVVRRKSLGLVTQTSALRIKDRNLNLIHGDTTPEDFEKSWKKIPMYSRLLVQVLAPIYGVWGYLTATRNSLASGHSVEQIATYDDSFDDQNMQAFKQTIIDERDKILVEVLDEHVNESGEESQTTAIVYGASHMPVAFAALSKMFGYNVAKAEWIQVI
jgi:hypothetical protein